MTVSLHEVDCEYALSVLSYMKNMHKGNKHIQSICQNYYAYMENTLKDINLSLPQ
jgi:hypothetical protein